MSYTKKAAAFGKLVGICAGYEGTYNPARQNLTTSAIRSLAKNADQANFTVVVARQNWITAAGKRKTLFSDLKETVKRLRGEVLNMNTSAATKNLLMSALSKTSAIGVAANTDPPVDSNTASEPKSRRASGKDFATRLAAFEAVVNALATEPDYKPSISSLSVAFLKAKVDELKGHTGMVNASFAELAEARNARRRIFRQSGTGVIAIAKGVKNAVKAIFGNPSDELKNVRAVVAEISQAA